MPFSELLRRLRVFTTRRQFDADLEDEMRLHVALREQRLREGGLSPDDASRQARRKFGHPTRISERSREVWGFRGLEAAVQDLGFALRLLRRSPAFTLIAVTALALGIGATTAIFSVVDAVMLRSLPFQAPGRLVMVWEDASNIGFPHNTPAPGNYADWTTAVTSLSGAAALDIRDYNLTGVGTPEKVGAAGVTSNLFTVLGVAPALGRAILPAEDVPGGERVAVIGQALWMRRFGSDTAVIGRPMLLNGEKYTIVGVMPPRFSFPFRDIEVWVPMGFTREDLANRGGHYLWVVGRMTSAATLTGLNAELATLAARRAKDFPETNRGVGMFAVPLLQDYIGDLGTALAVLLGAVGVVLLITCANLANLLLSKATGRAREMAVRTALGAGTGRLVRQMLVENVLLALLGGAAGLLVAAAALGVLRTLVPEALQDISVVQLDWRVMTFALLLAAGTGVLVGLVPARQVRRTDVALALKQGAPASVGGRHPARSILVVAEIAGAMVLVVCAALMIESFSTLRSVDLGFRGDHLLTVRLPLPQTAYAEFERRTAFADRVLGEVRALPGVRSAGFTSALPLVWKGGTLGFWPEGSDRPDPALSYDANNRVVSQGFMETMHMTLRQGRFVGDQDSSAAPLVVLVNETLARQYWGTTSAVGRRLKLGAPTASVPWRTVVGVVADVRSMGLDQPARSEIYFPLAQSKGNWMWPRDLVVRTDLAPDDLIAAIRRAVWKVDPTQPVANVATMDEIVDREVVQRRTQTRLLAAFAGLALLLACLGIYGVLSLSVSERSQEIGLRMALGARRGQILGTVVGGGMRLAVLGVALGTLGAFWATRLMSGLLYGVQPHDPRLFAALAGALLLVAFVAVYVPARRASRVDPLISLRAQ